MTNQANSAPQKAERSRRKRLLLSPLTRRILLVNILAVLIPVIGLLYLGPYKQHLIAQEMEALRTQGEIFSGALGEGAISILDNGQQVLNLVPARHIVRRLSQPTRVRARLFIGDGTLVADSRLLSGYGQTVKVEDLAEPGSAEEEALAEVLDVMGLLSDLMMDSSHPRYLDRMRPTVGDYPEAGKALGGEISGYVRQDENGRLVLSVALPVQRYYQIFGALMLSKGGHEIEMALREVRFNILVVFAGALVVTTLLSLYLAGVIARPLHKLAEAAERVRHSVGRDDEHIPDFTARRDEIGELSRSLREMTAALRQRMTAIERFAADVAHEIKNPLTSLRSAVETAARVQDPAQQQKLMHIIQEDVQRLDRLISDISDASRLDAELSRSETEEIDLARMVEALAEMHNTTAGERGVPKLATSRIGDGPFLVQGNDGRLVQVFRNLIGNAVSFSPEGGRLSVALSREGEQVQAVVQDDGPGIPENKLEDIFSRFYSERPEGERFGTHSGLGLSISKQIIEGHGGTIRAENRVDGHTGARFVIQLPAN